MTDPAPTPPPEKPVLLPIGEALAKAVAEQEAEAAKLDAEKQARADREADRQSILRTYRAHGLAKAKRIGKVYGWSAEDVTAVCEPPRPTDDGPVGRPDAPPGAPPAPPPGDPDAPAPPRKRTNPVKRLPADCPVTPLGTMGGEFYYLTPLKELTALRKHSADDVRALFAQAVLKGDNSRGIDWLWNAFPKFNKDQLHTGWDIAHAGESLMTACASRGVFDPGQQLRGVGAWTDNAGGLVLHCGDVVYAHGEWHPPGVHGEHVYPGARPRPGRWRAKPRPNTPMRCWTFTTNGHGFGPGRTRICLPCCILAAAPSPVPPCCCWGGPAPRWWVARWIGGPWCG